MTKVSVVIPAFNSMRFLPKTLESVFNQTYSNFEILIIDDGSSDNIKQWISCLSHPKVRFITQKNQGASVARNTGIKYAQGQYIAFLDADDLWEPRKLEKQVRYLDLHPQIGLVHSWVYCIDAQGELTGNILKSDLDGSGWEQMLERNHIACCSVLVRRECFDLVGNFDANLRSAEDWDMWIRISSSYQIGLIREPLAFYRLLESSKSKKCELVHKSLSIIIEKTFQDAPPDLLPLKARSYGYANLNLAWKSIQCREKNYRQARYFRQQAIRYYPELRLTKNCLKLTIGIFLVSLLGSDNYSRFLNILFKLRRHKAILSPVFIKQQIKNSILRKPDILAQNSRGY